MHKLNDLNIITFSSSHLSKVSIDDNQSLIFESEESANDWFGCFFEPDSKILGMTIDATYTYSSPLPTLLEGYTEVSDNIGTDLDWDKSHVYVSQKHAKIEITLNSPSNAASRKFGLRINTSGAKFRLTIDNLKFTYHTEQPNSERIRLKNFYSKVLHQNNISDFHYYNSDPEIESIFHQYLSSHCTAYDLGANVGRLTEKMFHIVGDNSSIISVDANPLTFKELLKYSNIDRKVKFLPILGAIVGTPTDSVDFFINPDLNELGSLDKDYINNFFSHERNFGNQIKVMVPAFTIDELSKITNTIPKLIKIDIESFEFEALKNSKIPFENKSIIIFEFNTAVYPDKGIEFFKLFKKWDYNVYDIFGNELTIDTWTFPERCPINRIAVPSSISRPKGL